MSKIDKLGIRGIRSFDPDTQVFMQFNAPLTLIVGYNGSGKTTIIEALKYATTGEQPPNSKNGAFVHDPMLHGENTVLAQVKLSFQSTTGQHQLVTRSLQVKMKKTQRVMSSLDGSLLTYNNGQRENVPKKVAELNTLVPSCLGVSPAILDAVIFCHQDESLWPMSEPAALKKRFDEIFEALRYTKAIDNIRILRKKKGEELQRLKILEATSKEAKQKGQRVEKQMTTLQAQIEDLREQAEDLTRQMDDMQAEAKDRRAQAASFFGVVQELKSKEDQYHVRSEAVAELKANIGKMRTESDEWLEDHLHQYEKMLSRLQQDTEAREDQLRQVQAELSQHRIVLGDKQAEQGKFQADKEQYGRQLQARIHMVHQAAELHGIRGYEEERGHLSESDIRCFHERLGHVLQGKRRELEQQQRDHAKEIERDAAAITELETRKAARTQDRVSARQRIIAMDRRMAALQRDVQNLDVDEGAQALLLAAYDHVEAQLKCAAGDLHSSDTDAQIETERNKTWQLESESERLTHELVECMRRASDRAQLDLRKKEHTDRQRRLETLRTTWHERLGALVGANWAPPSLDVAFQSVLEKHVAAAVAARKNVEASQQELKQIEYTLSTMRSRQQNKEAEGARCQAEVLKVLRSVKAVDGSKSSDTANNDYSRSDGGGGITVDDYQEEFDNLESEVLIAEKDISLFDHLKDYYSKSQKVLNRFNKCSLCDRSFTEQPRERSKLLEKISKNLDDKQKKELEQDKEVLERHLGQLRAVRSQYDTFRRLEAELPGLQTEREVTEAKRDSIVRHLEDLDAVFKAADERRQGVESMVKTVTSITQAVREVVDAERQIERLEQQQQHATSASAPVTPSRSAEEIQERQAQLAEELRASKLRATKLAEERQRLRDSISGLELEKSELKNQMAEAARQAERKADLMRQIQSLKEEGAQQRELIQQTDEALEALEPELVQARAMRQDTLQQGRDKERVAVEARDAVAQTVGELQRIEADIQGYLERGGPEALAGNTRAMAVLAQAVADAEQATAQLVAQVSQMRTEQDNSDREKKNVADNLSYRRNSRLLDGLRAEILALQGRHAGEDYDRLVGEASRLEMHHSKLLAERSALWGSMKTKDEELRRLIEEYQQEYQDADERYRQAHIRVETTKAAIEDMGRYAAALDKAIMEYHALKMEEVNRVAGELWRATYQGTDIDTILIRSDSDEASSSKTTASATAASTKRSYNYRVCMVKQDTEMDMRGRCSAGQKVLASIIIRLALAESFGVNCGLIALDEPTTNLDSDNIRSLAVALHGIIRARQAQANFQLIVITHDEEFLRHMQCSDFCDTFYRVLRDDKQKSIIRMENISTLIEG